jgi:hypothetical protein
MPPTADPGASLPAHGRGGSTYYASTYRQPAPAASQPPSTPQPSASAASQPPSMPQPPLTHQPPAFPPIPEFPTPPPFLSSEPPRADAFPTPPLPVGAGPMAPTRRRRIPPVVVFGVLAGVLLLCAAGSVTTYLLLAHRHSGAGPSSAGPPGSAVQPGDEEAVTGDLARFKQGDCLTVEPSTNHVTAAPCTTTGAYRVLLRRDGTIDDAVCRSTEATASLHQDGPGAADDFVLCVAPVA